MMNNKFFEFLHNHNIYDDKVYKYYLNNANNFDYYNEDMFRSYIGCSFITSKNKILKQIIPIVPYPVDDITTLINIHEYVHTLGCYDKINKRFKSSVSDEILPIFYEKLFVLENNNTKLNNYEEFLDNAALESNDEKYLLGVKVSKYLLDDYNYDEFNKLNKKIKKLSKKYY